jgi:hypothetical protein
MTKESISRPGVSYRPGLDKWSSRITVNKKRLSLGMYTNRIDAIAAREQAEIKYNMAPRPDVTELTQETLKQLLSYDPETGIFRWLFTDRKAVTGAIAGCLRPDPKNPYWLISLFGKSYCAHRLAWLYMTGAFPADQTDHINQIKHDNRFVNLREVNTSVNAMNRKLPAHNTSGCIGVNWHKRNKRWQAKITVNRKTLFLGYFRKLENAIKARKEAEKEYGFHKNHGKGGA